MNLSDFTAQAITRLESLFATYIVETYTPAATLQEAITYSTLNGGKRIRPLLVYLAGNAFDAPWHHLDAPACAIELIHVYSLIHDDLPAMDNSDLRRGKPSCHKAFNDATAILAGDALQPLAFEIIATHPAGISAAQRLEMIKTLTHACGIRGMAAGQMLDMQGMTSLSTLKEMYHLKTGALLSAAVSLGAISANISNPALLDSLEIFAKNIGLAFQIQDDLLDAENAHATGKPQGLDQTNQKMTYISLLGIEKSREHISTLFNAAMDSLNFLGEKKKRLCEFANELMQRNK